MSFFQRLIIVLPFLQCFMSLCRKFLPLIIVLHSASSPLAIRRCDLEEMQTRRLLWLLTMQWVSQIELYVLLENREFLINISLIKTNPSWVYPIYISIYALKTLPYCKWNLSQPAELNWARMSFCNPGRKGDPTTILKSHTPPPFLHHSKSLQSLFPPKFLLLWLEYTNLGRACV